MARQRCRQVRGAVGHTWMSPRTGPWTDTRLRGWYDKCKLHVGAGFLTRYAFIASKIASLISRQRPLLLCMLSAGAWVSESFYEHAELYF
jgi:hypothetical protein